MAAAYQLKVGINGLGVLGRRLLRMLLDEKLNTFSDNKYEFQVTGINDLSDPEQLVYLLKYDTVYGKWDKTIEYDSIHGVFIIGGQHIALLQVPPKPSTYWEDINWASVGAETVFDCTGLYTSYEALHSHINGGAKQVVGIAQTSFDNFTPMFVYGINQKIATDADYVVGIPAAQSIVNSIVASILNENFGVDCGICMDIGSYTNLNNLQDSAISSQKLHPQNGRAGAWNLIYSGIDYGKVIGKIVPILNGKVVGQEVRSGTIRGAISCGSYTLQKAFDIDTFVGVWGTLIPTSIQDADSTRKPLISKSEDALVSSDVVGEICAFFNGYKSIAGSNANQVSIKVIYDPITLQAANAMLMAAYMKELVG